MRQDSFPSWVRQFLLPVTIILLLLGLPYLVRPIAQVLLAIFAGILLAIFLNGSANLLKYFMPIPRWVALALVILLIFLFIFGLSWIAGARLAEQAAGLMERLPAAVEAFRARLADYEWLRQFFSDTPPADRLGNLLGNVTAFFSSTVGILGNLLIIAFIGIYMAITPSIYTLPLLSLLPPSRRERGREVLNELGRVLQYWLVGRLASMAIVGVLTAVGLLLIGQPLALILGVLAGLLSFIPFLGPLLSAIPALLVALTENFMMAVWVAVVFLVVQVFESNLITPLIQRRAVRMPPAFALAGQFLLGALFGFYGILLATPLIVVFTVLVQLLYIQDMLGDSVHTLGNHD